MISTANYVARRFGVRSAMPGFIALKLCPQLTFVKSDFEKYAEASEETRYGCTDLIILLWLGKEIAFLSR